MRDDLIDQAAGILARARLDRSLFDGFQEVCRPRDEGRAYEIQERLHKQLEREGLGRMIGHKIGCTTKVMQRYLGIHNPCSGGIFSSTVQEDSGQFRYDDFRRVGVECEIAVRLGAGLPKTPSLHDRQTVIDAIETCMVAIEIVDDRYLDYKALDTPTLIADDFFNAGAVLGSPTENWRDLDLVSIEGQMTVNGEAVGSGRGGDILGHPLNALAWLASAVNGRGDSLRKAEIVLLGSIVQTCWLKPGDRVEVEIDGLGKASALFA